MKNLKVINSKPMQSLTSHLLNSLTENPLNTAYVSTMCTEHLAQQKGIKTIFSLKKEEEIFDVIELIQKMDDVNVVIIDRLNLSNREDILKAAQKMSESGKLWIAGQQIARNGDLSYLNEFANDKSIYEIEIGETKL